MVIEVVRVMVSVCVVKRDDFRDRERCVKCIRSYGIDIETIEKDSLLRKV